MVVYNREWQSTDESACVYVCICMRSCRGVKQAMKSFLHVFYRHVLEENGTAMACHISLSLVVVKGPKGESF